MITDYYLPPLSQLRFLLKNEQSASGIAVLCSCQKFIVTKKSTLKLTSWFFQKIESKSIKTVKSRIVTTLIATYETRCVSWQMSMQFCSWKKSDFLCAVVLVDCLAVDVRLASSSCSSVCHASINPDPLNSSSIPIQSWHSVTNEMKSNQMVY